MDTDSNQVGIIYNIASKTVEGLKVWLLGYRVNIHSREVRSYCEIYDEIYGVI